MKRMLAAAIAMGVLAIGAPAMAEVTGSIGYNTVKVDPVDLATVNARLSWDSSSWFGLEGEAGIGTKDDTVNGPPPVKIKVDSIIAAFATARYEMNPNFSLRARVGVNSIKISGKAGGAKASADGSNLTYGVGAQYLFDGKTGVRVDYTRLDSDSADSWGVALVHKF
ncbi:MAG: hypothetical protein JWM33_2848 [Caulobacteraceae bacterium]|nr:hypothetical protein [Caulobacteraceae bacterium]